MSKLPTLSETIEKVNLIQQSLYTERARHKETKKELQNAIRLHGIKHKELFEREQNVVKHERRFRYIISNNAQLETQCSNLQENLDELLRFHAPFKTYYRDFIEKIGVDKWKKMKVKNGKIRTLRGSIRNAPCGDTVNTVPSDY